MEQNNAVVDYTAEESVAINDRIDAHYKKLIAEGKYKDLLLRCGENGKYSVNNIILMLEQNPEMTVAKGMNEWAKEGRHIKEGAQSMEIVAPTKERYEVEVKDGDGNPVLGEDGNPQMRQREKTAGFHAMYVFDITATEGDPYKPYKIKGKMSDAEKKNILDGVFNALSAKHYKYKFTDEAEFGENEDYKIDKSSKTVKLRKGMDNSTTALTAIEAASKAICDNYKGRAFEGMTGANAEKIEADSRGCILAAHFGLDTSGYNFDYMQSMSEEQADMFKNNLGLISASTKLVMDKISRAFYKDQQARAEAAPEVQGAGVPEVEFDPFCPDGAGHSDMEAA